MLNHSRCRKISDHQTWANMKHLTGEDIIICYEYRMFGPLLEKAHSPAYIGAISIGLMK